ncbi:VOC family protein [Jiella sonneratiae]|uniref:VOC family protein n=1 Tax=Jiella sonneratiae TaxID=2816856 RepID=A0ABS3J2M7_9HYPH|nr:VOC family protein [Jiella sonneratiae]MBO0903931.1 VOC family protein [Jiella sonneratiae]
MTSSVIPTLRYADARAMIDWLCSVLGFERRAVHEADDGTILHAELVHGAGMVMVGEARDDDFGACQAPPSGGDARVTQSPYVVVTDIDRLYEAVKAAGATVVMDLADKDYGSREFSCRDPEGHLWNFGTYDPWRTGV